MHLLSVCLTLFSILSLATALPRIQSLQSREALAYRNWDLRFLSEAPPTCDPGQSNIKYSTFHRSGINPRGCEALNTVVFNATNLKSISWKSPGASSQLDICMFSTADCSGGNSTFLGSITNGWDVCHLYNGFLGWTVIAHGDDCYEETEVQ